jgi:6-phosphogluconolactonase
MVMLRYVILLMFTLPIIASEFRVYFGTYTRDGRSKGIYCSDFSEEKTGAKLGDPVLAAAASNPTFLAYDASRGLILATGDKPAADGKVEGCVRVFSEKREGNGLLTLLGERLLGISGAPAHIILSHDARMVLAAHYNEGVVFALPPENDRRPGAVSARFVHTGVTGPKTQRQERAHAHSVTVSPDDRYAFACDLGLDRIVRYALDTHAGTLKEDKEGFAVSTPGFGPRHAKFSGDGRQLYVENELAGTIDVFAYEAQTGGLRHLQTLSTLPPGYTGENTSAEVQVHPNGRFVYASNRGPDTLAVFARDSKTGLLTPLQSISSGGKHPRHFALSPDGNFLICANRDTDNVVLFRVDSEQGTLSPTGEEVSVPSPICVAFAASR